MPETNHPEGSIMIAGARRSTGRPRRNLCIVLALLAGGAEAAVPAQAPISRESQSLKAARPAAERIGSGPIIRPDMPGLEGELGDNIDGPSVIKVPGWIKKPLGRYYMYFAHHRGKYIRLAYADDPKGPWTVYRDGTLKLDQTSALHHVASPDVIVDDEKKHLILYYHGPTEAPGGKYGGRPYEQKTFVATSADGILFKAESGAIAPPYMKAFRYKGYTYGLAMGDKTSAYPLWLRSGLFVRSQDGIAPFETGPRILDEMRHTAVVRRGDTLHVFYTIVGDEPERILYTTVDLRPDWSEWTASAPVEVLRPELAYEGADVPLAASRGGMASGREHALRDPGVLDDAGQLYLYYAVAGEKGIGVAKIGLEDRAPPVAK
jgi:hypothetical protein